jgi:hypothetical protein
LLGIRHFLQSLSFFGRMILPIMIMVMNSRMILEEAITPDSIRDHNACVYLTLCRKSDSGHHLTGDRGSSSVQAPKERA